MRPSGFQAAQCGQHNQDSCGAENMRRSSQAVSCGIQLRHQTAPTCPREDPGERKRERERASSKDTQAPVQDSTALDPHLKGFVGGARALPKTNGGAQAREHRRESCAGDGRSPLSARIALF